MEYVLVALIPVALGGGIIFFCRAPEFAENRWPATFLGACFTVSSLPALWIAAYAKSVQCDESCSNPTAHTWPAGAWQWTAQFDVAVAAAGVTFAATLIAVAGQRRAASYFAGLAAFIWLGWLAIPALF